MKIYNIPNGKSLEIRNILFDINGTIQFDGNISREISQKIMELKEFFNIILVSADTRGNLKELAELLKVRYEKLDQNRPEHKQKGEIIEKYNKDHTIAVGNGKNDELMLSKAILGIVVIGSEGASVKAINAADIVVNNPIDAINIILDEKKVIATLRR
jgi:soluble P-type ATPase